MHVQKSTSMPCISPHGRMSRLPGNLPNSCSPFVSSTLPFTSAGSTVLGLERRLHSFYQHDSDMQESHPSTMPNLRDCPREIRDLCYKAYFESVLQEGHDKFMHTFPITWSNRNIGLEAVEVCLERCLHLQSRLIAAQAAIVVVTALLEATDSELDKVVLARSKANKMMAVTAKQPVTIALYQNFRHEFLNCSTHKKEVERRRGKQCATASRLRRRLRWLNSTRE